MPSSVLLLWSTIFYFFYQSKKAAYETLFRMPMAGKIQALQQQNKGAAIVVTVHNSRYWFVPTDYQGGARGFIALAAVGDSIRKRAFSDTLVLVKPNRVVHYAFKKAFY